MTSLTQERTRLQARDLEQARRERIARAQARTCCPECGAVDGMMALHPQHVIAYLDHPHRYPWPARGMYRLPDVDDHLYTPCDLCCGAVDEAYEPMASQVHVRMWARRFRQEEVAPPEEYQWDPNLGGFFNPCRADQVSLADELVEPAEVEVW